MIVLDDIVSSIKTKNIRITDHADEETANDALSLKGVYHSVINGEIIEQYPEDQPYPSCLIFGRNEDNEPIHSVWAYNKNTRGAVLITVYRPDPALWKDWRVRRKP